MSRPRQGDIQKPHVLLRAFALHGGQSVGVLAGQVDLQPAVPVMPENAVAPVRLRAATGEKRQEHQRVFQPFGLVQRDHAHARIFAFQPQHAFLRGIRLFGQPLQVPQHADFTVNAGGVGLQAFGQMQQVGELPFAAFVAAGKEARRQPVVVQQGQQHRQHALLAPGLAVAAEALAGAFPFTFVVEQPVQPGIVEAQCGGGQRQPQAGVVFGVEHGIQPAHQVLRFLAGKDRVLVRQVHRPHAAQVQGPADGGGFLPVAHQHGHVAREQRLESAVTGQQAGSAVVEQGGDGFGGPAGKLLAVVVLVAGFLAPGQRQGRHGHAALHQLLAPAGGPHGLEGNVRPAEYRFRYRAGFGRTAEQPVDHADHGHGRAPVGVEGVALFRPGIVTGGEIGEDVGAAKGVDRLLRIADHQQPQPRLRAGIGVQRAENGVLGRVGILEFVDQGNRVGLAQGLGQTLAVRAVRRQRLCQPADHVVKADFRPAGFFGRQRCGDAAGGVGQQGSAQAGVGQRRLQQPLDGKKRLRRIE